MRGTCLREHACVYVCALDAEGEEVTVCAAAPQL